MKRLVLVFLAVTLIPIGIFELIKYRNETASRGNANVAKSPAQIVSQLITHEELIRRIDLQIKELDRALKNLSIPGTIGRSLFADSVDYQAMSGPLVVSTDNKVQHVSVNTPKQINVNELKIWEPIFNQVAYFHQAKFQSVRVVEKTIDTAIVETTFSGLARKEDKSWLGIQAFGTLTWQFSNSDRPIIAGWNFDKLVIQPSRSLTFDEITDYAFSMFDLPRVKQSMHQEKMLKGLKNGPSAFKNSIEKSFFPRGGSTGRHPALSIVDIDQDGWDDLYIVELWRNNLLFRNKGDGTFEEKSAHYGLDLPGYGSTALFADFDNDGDQDLFLGRSLAKSQYLENDGGKFVDRSESKFDFELPALVSSVTSADCNNDGLLDLYVTTFGFTGISTEHWTNVFLDGEDRQHIIDLVNSPDYNRFLNAAGPKNLLLINRGSKFEVSAFNSQVSVWGNSFQGTWCDFDQDGDQDLFVANAFKRDHLFRNDREDGFTDVTYEVGQDSMRGCSAGVSWGDFDLDGQHDLFVSNLQSNDGLRIIDHFGNLDPKFRQSANGSRLYSNSNGRLNLVSSNEGEGFDVCQTGWSWGGQFFDVENDGFLDLYVTAGYFTAPRMFASSKDLSSEFWRTVVRSTGGLEQEFVSLDQWNDQNQSRGQNYSTLEYAMIDGKRRPIVHSIDGNQRNKLFNNRSGSSFHDTSLISGADSIADGRCFALWDYDHDGFQDIALVNMNAPHIQLFRNQSAIGTNNHFVVLDLIGGNSRQHPSTHWSTRDAVGAVAIVHAGDKKIVREFRKGEGLSCQNSSTMIIGIGEATQADSIEIRWPSGKVQRTDNASVDTQYTFYENPEDSVDGQSIIRNDYERTTLNYEKKQPFGRPPFDFDSAQPKLQNQKLAVYITMATSCESCIDHLDEISQLKNAMPQGRVAFFGIPIDNTDSKKTLRAYCETHDPAYTLLLDLTSGDLVRVGQYLDRTLGTRATPTSVIVGVDGSPMEGFMGIPTASDVLKYLDATSR